jgi:biopolymer transport protein ExbD
MSGPSFAAEPQLNATPLIDVLLVLLIMLIFTLPIATHAVKLNLPQGKAQLPAAQVYVDIAADGGIFWNGEPIAAPAALRTRFAELAGLQSPPQVFVAPERLAPYERVAQVLALAQRSQVKALRIEPIRD